MTLSPVSLMAADAPGRPADAGTSRPCREFERVLLRHHRPSFFDFGSGEVSDRSTPTGGEHIDAALADQLAPAAEG